VTGFFFFLLDKEEEEDELPDDKEEEEVMVQLLLFFCSGDTDRLVKLGESGTLKIGLEFELYEVLVRLRRPSCVHINVCMR